MDDSTGAARALYFESPGTVSIRREEVRCGEGEVVVESLAIGISHGSEMLFYNGPFPRGQLLEARETIGESTGYPVKYGYMNVGRIAEDDRRVFAFFPHQDRFAYPRDELLFVPDSVSTEDAVLYPTIETAVQIVHDTAPVLGETVLVCGVGAVGLTVAYLLRRLSLRVVVTDPVPERRARAAEAGCVAIDPATEDARSVALDAASSLGFDWAINTSGRGEALQLAIDSLSPEGTVVEASWYGERRAELNLGAGFHRKRLTIRGSQVSHLNPRMEPRWSRARRSELAWRLAEEIEPRRFITHRFALDDAAQAYEVIRTRPEEAFQVVLIP
ncbi:MAG: zinc-dependent alcohol dehydrogenase [Spirochaetota bacterium]